MADEIVRVHLTTGGVSDHSADDWYVNNGVLTLTRRGDSGEESVASFPSGGWDKVERVAAGTPTPEDDPPFAIA